ncbi:chemotaxis protein CheW [Pannus brasiliensis CCIBt3594]|uniref:Chemotaxis protein CheW n=1 Tax=Pannus brasiliensis CCIBt3594 TaxID=1427578 RepID=A0AAW9QZE3_9CHRO
MNYYLTFTHNNLHYGVPATAVQEVFLLPEITPIPEAPADIIGTINVRGKIVPIMDLNLRFGYTAVNYSLNNSIIVLNWQEITIGIVTDRVQTVKSIDSEVITPELSHDHPLLDFKQEKFIGGFLQEDDRVLLLLDLESLLRYVDAQELNLDLDLDTLILDDLEIPAESDRPKPETPESPKSPIFFPSATPYERKVLQKRAESLRQELKLKDITGLKPVAVFSLNQEFFGIDLSLIQEFITFDRVTIVPCSPPFIIGNINLRGEIVTLIDIRSLFNLPRSIHAKNTKAVIVNVEGITAGLLIDTIQDIFMLDPKTIMDASALESDIDRSYLQGVIPYQEKMLGLVNLTEIILGGSLLVDEAV